MSYGTAVPIASAVLQLAFAVVFLMLARAPGWQRARMFALLAFGAGCYSTVNVAFTLPGLELATLQRCLSLNYLFGALNCALWLGYAYSRPDHRWRAVPRTIRFLIAITIAIGIAAASSGAMHRDVLVHVDLPRLHTHYVQAEGTDLSGLVGGWYLVTLGVVIRRFIGAARRGEPGARLQLAGFGTFLLCAVIEVLVTNGVIVFVYPADFGFLAVVAATLVETLRRLVFDAHRLAELGRDLSDQVEHRTRERDRARDALAHAERLAAIGQLAAGAGHEINNPLAIVRGNLELLRNGAGHAELIADAIDGADRIARVVADLRVYALPDTDRRERVELDAAVRAALKLASHRLRHVATVVEELGAGVAVRADPVRLSQVFVNLLVNAGQALEDVAAHRDPRITIRSRALPGGRARIEIIDNGVGIPADALSRLSQPYFSTRVARGGTGLGLFISRGILTSLGGVLSFASEPGRGTTAIVELPADAATDLEVAAAPAEPAPTKPPSAPGLARPRVLLVDDEPMLARMLARSLPHADVTIALSGHEALARIADQPAFDAIVCDLMMPNGSGIDLHAELATSRPALLSRVMFLTGGAVTPSAQAFLARSDVRHLEKPCDRDALTTFVDAAAAS